MDVGFIGLGNMGNPMAHNILRAGFPLTVHDLRPAVASSLINEGARWADTPAAVARQAETIILSVPGPPQVEAVMRGENGVLAGLQSGATWIDMSTSSRQLFRRLAGEVQARGGHALDAPVTGAVDGAQRGGLTIFVGGDASVLDRQRPVLQAMGQTIFHAGPLGAGLVAKLLTNLLWFIHAAALGEGLVLGARAGIDLPVLWEIIKSSAGNSWVAEHDTPSVFRGDYDPSFTLDLCCKDLGLIHDLGAELDVPLELGALAEQIFQRARVTYGGNRGEMHVVKLLEDATGTVLQLPQFRDRIDDNLSSTT